MSNVAPEYPHHACDVALTHDRPEDACDGCRNPAAGPRHAFAPAPEGVVALDEMLATGATYRRLDYWVRQGYLSPTDAAPGSGYARAWTPRDLIVVKVMLRLTSVGLPVASAASWAAACADDGLTTVTVNDVTITWEKP
jgi:hypothetical protein